MVFSVGIACSDTSALNATNMVLSTALVYNRKVSVTCCTKISLSLSSNAVLSDASTNCCQTPYVGTVCWYCCLCDWKYYPTFLTLVLGVPLILMAYSLFTLLLNVSTPATLYLLVTRWDSLCVFVLKTLCLKFALLLCVYSRPQSTYSGVEMSIGTIRQLSGHPTFSTYSVFCWFFL